MKKQKFNHDWIFTVGSGSSLDALAGGNNTAKQVTLPRDASIGRAVSYTHLTLPTNREVEISVGAGALTKKKNKKRERVTM